MKGFLFINLPFSLGGRNAPIFYWYNISTALEKSLKTENRASVFWGKMRIFDAGKKLYDFGRGSKCLHKLRDDFFLLRCIQFAPLSVVGKVKIQDSPRLRRYFHEYHLQVVLYHARARGWSKKQKKNNLVIVYDKRVW